ncbi:MAG: protein translocase subunit SecF [bacterium]|nr:protein translocase subunit SecF [bacterium]
MTMKLFPENTNFDFIGKSKYAIALSIAISIMTVYLWVSKGDSKYGIDYKGGTEIVIKLSENTESQIVREALEAGGVKDATVQSFEAGSQEYSIKVSGSEDTTKNSILAALKAKFADKVSIERTDVVGPTIGEELRAKALIAIIFGLIGIMIYVSVRFEFAFAVGALGSLIHDVFVCTGIYLLAGREINASTLAATLAIVGYSVNDTIVIFDRVREEILKTKKFEIVPLINKCINITFSRTMITGLLTLFSALALLIYGGGSISDLSFYMVVGIITGGYSTIFIASPIVIAFDRWSRSREAARGAISARS